MHNDQSKKWVSVITLLAVCASAPFSLYAQEDSGFFSIIRNFFSDSKVRVEAEPNIVREDSKVRLDVGKVRSGERVRGEMGSRVRSDGLLTMGSMDLRVSTEEMAPVKPERTILVQPSSADARKEAGNVILVRELSQALQEAQGGEDIVLVEGGNFELYGTLDRVRLMSSPEKRATLTVSGDVIVRDTTLTGVDIKLGTSGRLVYEGHVIFDHTNVVGGNDPGPTSSWQPLIDLVIGTAYAAGGVTMECGNKSSFSGNAGYGVGWADTLEVSDGCKILNNGMGGTRGGTIKGSGAFEISGNGGIGINFDTVDISGGKIIGNLMGVAGKSVTISGTEIANNKEFGILMDTGGTLDLNNKSKVYGNGASAIYAAGPVTIQNSEIYNHASKDYSAIQVDKGPSASLSIRNSSVHDNDAGIFSQASVAIENSEIYNHASKEFAAITVTKNPSASLSIKGSSVHDNYIGITAKVATKIGSNSKINKNTVGIFATGDTQITDSNIHENTLYGVYAAPGSTIDLTHNNDTHSIYANNIAVGLRPGSSLNAHSNDFINNKNGIIAYPADKNEKGYPAPKAKIANNQFHYNAISVMILNGAPNIGPSNNFQNPEWCGVLNASGNTLYAYNNTWMHSPPSLGTVVADKEGNATCSNGVDIANYNNGSVVETVFDDPIIKALYGFHKAQAEQKEKERATNEAFEKSQQPKETCPPGTPKQLCKYLEIK